MKVGIITLYDSQNYGAFLQAFALSSFLKNRGITPTFVNLNTNKIPEYLFMIKTKNIPLAIFRIKQAIKYHQSRHLLEIGSKESIKEEYDYAFIGSDTLWDVMNNSYPHYDCFLGYNVNAKRIIAYAPSCNMTTAKDLIRVYGKKASFEKFNCIGVRDKRTFDLVREISDNYPQIVVDPTFLIDVEEYPVEYMTINRKYALIYSYGFKDNEIKEIQNYCNAKGLLTVSVGLYNRWCNKNITATVPQFLGLIDGAECVITTTFHGTIMSMLRKKNYACFAGNNYKVLDLLKRTGNEKHNASCISLSDVLMNNDGEIYNHAFKKEIDDSKLFISNALNY